MAKKRTWTPGVGKYANTVELPKTNRSILKYKGVWYMARGQDKGKKLSSVDNDYLEYMLREWDLTPAEEKVVRSAIEDI